MLQDKYTAVWVSHTSISDFIKCPRAYFLKNIYRDPKTGHKIRLVTPPMALGFAVHEVLDALSYLPVKTRFKESLVIKLHEVWNKITGKKGGFISEESELKYKKRAEEILNRLAKNPGPLAKLAVKIQMDLPNYWLSEKDNIILCGKIDWLEYIPKGDSVHIIDFKTSKNDEDGDSLQLDIYYLLATNCQSRKVSKVSYWYLERVEGLVKEDLPDLQGAYNKILEIAKQIKVARQLNHFKCPQGENGCRFCRPMEAILQGNAEFVGVDGRGSDVYMLDPTLQETQKKSVIL